MLTQFPEVPKKTTTYHKIPARKGKKKAAFDHMFEFLACRANILKLIF